MKVAIIHSVCSESAAKLKEYLEFNGIRADIHKPFDTGRQYFDAYDWVFSLGCSALTFGKNFDTRINYGSAVSRCISKVLTFTALQKVGVPIPEWTTEYNKIPKHWDQVCVRQSLDGRAGDGMSFHYRDEKIPKGALYTQVHYGKNEYRIVVFKGEIIGRYIKNKMDDSIVFENMPPKGFKSIDTACLKAAKALGIDYVGFDVLAHSKKDFVILEANSGAVVTDEAALAITQFFLDQKG